MSKRLSLPVVLAVSAGHASNAHEYHAVYEHYGEPGNYTRALPGFRGDLEALEQRRRKPVPL